jgi:hypothetical protein
MLSLTSLLAGLMVLALVRRAASSVQITPT